MTFRRWIIAAFSVLIASPCFAQDSPGWSLDVGAAARIRPDHVGAGRDVVDLAPIVEGQFGDRLRISFDDGIRWSVLKSGPMRAGPVLEYRQIYNDHLPGGHGGYFDGDLEFGGFVAVETPLGEGEVRLRKALSGYRGWSGDIAWDVGFDLPAGFSLGAEARASWTDAAYLDRQFGLLLVGRRALSLGHGDSYTAGLEVGVSHPIGKRLTAVFSVSDDRLLGAAPNSPLFRSRDDVVADFGVVYRFGSRPGR